MKYESLERYFYPVTLKLIKHEQHRFIRQVRVYVDGNTWRRQKFSAILSRIITSATLTLQHNYANKPIVPSFCRPTHRLSELCKSNIEYIRYRKSTYWSFQKLWINLCSIIFFIIPIKIVKIVTYFLFF